MLCLVAVSALIILDSVVKVVFWRSKNAVVFERLQGKDVIRNFMLRTVSGLKVSGKTSHTINMQRGVMCNA